MMSEFPTDLPFYTSPYSITRADKLMFYEYIISYIKDCKSNVKSIKKQYDNLEMEIENKKKFLLDLLSSRPIDIEKINNINNEIETKKNRLNRLKKSLQNSDFINDLYSVFIQDNGD